MTMPAFRIGAEANATDEANLDQTTVLIGLVGSGIAASRTPALHEAEGRRQGLTYVYKRFDLDDFGDRAGDLAAILSFARLFGFSGLNVTYPCKTAVISLLDDLSAEARALGAVNTVVFSKGAAIGHNTDWSGFAHAFQRNLADVSRERVVQFGAGGAGAAVGYALLTLGVRDLAIVDIAPERAQQLVQQLCNLFGDGRARAGTMADVRTAQGIVNTTPMGMARLPGMAVDPDLLHADHWVTDIVYFPLETELLRQARQRGCRIMNGGGMAVFQAAEAFRLFTGRAADPERMLLHFARM